jgi:hypothetical protein
MNNLQPARKTMNMSLQDMELSPFLVNELYGDMLVGNPGQSAVLAKTPIAPKAAPRPLPDPEPAAVSGPLPAAAGPSAKEPIRFLGGNLKQIAFIVNSPAHVFLPEAELEWLGKMLEACQLNLGDVAIANLATAPFTVADIRSELRSQTVILLGTQPAMIQLPLNFPQFNPQTHDGMVFLCTPSPEELTQPTTEARVLKSKLWVCLQKLFKLQ